MGNFDCIRAKAIHIHGESVVLGGDLHLAGNQILDRLVGATVSEFQFVGTPAQSQTQNLVAQTDAEDRQPAQQVFDGLDAIDDRFRVACVARTREVPSGAELLCLVHAFMNSPG